MRITVFSDVHGNPHACQVVVDAIKKDTQSDVVIAAGDLCLGGSDPSACVDLIRGEGFSGVYGNTEEYIFEPGRIPPDNLHRSMWDRIQPVAQWVRAQLSDEQMSWLRELPFQQRFSPTQNPKDDLLVVHANPEDVILMIYPSEPEQVKLWGEVRQPDDHPDLLRSLKGTDAGLIAFGHFHYSFRRVLGSKTLVDVAPCSMPGIDYDPRPRYTIFTWIGDRWQIASKLLEYEISAEIRSLETSEMPYKEDFIRYYR